MQHRHAAAREAEDGARSHGGAVAEYYAAFRAIDQTLGDIATLLSQLMLYGPPQEVTMLGASWRRHEEEQRLDVSFKTDGFPERLKEVVRLATWARACGQVASSRSTATPWPQASSSATSRPPARRS
jgi:hypothetical protein